MRAFERTGETEFQVRDGTHRMAFAGRTDRSLVREFFCAHQIEPTPANFDRFLDRYIFLLDYFLGQLEGRICPGVPEFLLGLRSLPQPPMIGLLTGNIRLGGEIKLRRYGLWDVFAVGAFGDDHEDRNEIARIALHRGQRAMGCDLEPGETLVVGDTPLDIACGRAIGARVLAVGTGGAAMKELAGHRPDWLVEDLLQLPAEAVCR